jgi:hypothetical protein
MNRRAAWHYVVAVGLLAVVALVVVNVVQIASRPGDGAQIAAAIEEMRQASLAGRSGGVLEHMSKSFELPPQFGEQSGNPLGEVTRWVRQAQIQRLEVSDVQPEIYGSTAVAKATVQTDFQVLSIAFGYDGPVEFHFKKEVHRRLLVIPEAKWMLVSIGPLDPQHLRLNQ